MRDTTRERVMLLSAQGKPFTQSMARELAQLERIVFLCGRYEGVDERVNDLLADTELSIGDYVISGGELAAAVIVDAVSRLLPGVLGNEDSARYESFAAEPPTAGTVTSGSHNLPPIRRAARLPALHPAAGISRSGGACGVEFRQP